MMHDSKEVAFAARKSEVVGFLNWDKVVGPSVEIVSPDCSSIDPGKVIQSDCI